LSRQPSSASDRVRRLISINVAVEIMPRAIQHQNIARHGRATQASVCRN